VVINLHRGYIIAPPIFTHVENRMFIAQEEIFGPVLTVIAFKDENHAVQLANDTKYALASGIWTSDINRYIDWQDKFRQVLFG
jgi:acyl-CoA reductase-like NAD-dependent aldehyde dehydrogenase